MNPLLLKYAPYVLVVLVFLGMGAGINHLIEVRKLTAVQTDFANYRTRVANAESAAQKAAREALQAQITQSNETQERNDAVIQELNAKSAALAADRDHSADLVRRLLAAAAKTGTASGNQLPQTSGGPATSATGGASGDGRLAQLLGDTAAECRRNANRLDALSAQLAPQL